MLKSSNKSYPNRKTQLKKRIKSIIERLIVYYPDFILKIRRDPLDELIVTILSQATNDRNSIEAFKKLKKRFGLWGEVAVSPVKEIENAIRVGGLAPTKSKRIKKILESIAQRNMKSGHLRRNSPYHLDFLRKMEFDDARRFLTSLDGVGEKTAACVLLFSLHKPAFPIDTHVYRILVRHAIIPSKMPVEKAHDFMLELIEPSERYRLHVNLISYGREVCHARNPECGRCVVRRGCRFNP